MSSNIAKCRTWGKDSRLPKREPVTLSHIQIRISIYALMWTQLAIHIRILLYVTYSLLCVIMKLSVEFPFQGGDSVILKEFFVMTLLSLS